MAAHAGMVRRTIQVKPSQKSVLPKVLHWTGQRCVALVLFLAELFGHVDLIGCWYGMCGSFAVISMVQLNALLMGYRHAQESECYKGKQQTGLCGGKQL